jgi:ribosomal protein S18 acetylase RimI-like enzyme
MSVPGGWDYELLQLAAPVSKEWMYHVPNNQTYTLEKRLALGPDDLSAIRHLVEICEAADHAPVRISWTMLQARAGLLPLDVCCYLDGLLVGYLFMDHYDPKERETVILVHPAYRRRGIGQALLAEAREPCRQMGVERIVLLCERRVPAGAAFCERVGARFDFAEHEMALGEFQPRNARASDLLFRRAEASDLDALVAIQASSFGEPEDEVRPRIIDRWQDPTSRRYIVTFSPAQTGSTEPVGMVRLAAEAGETGIYGLGVAPAYQGRGYGRQIVEEAIRIARAENPQQAIMLDVAVSNTRAFNLYRSCGFQVRATYDYYALPVDEA